LPEEDNDSLKDQGSDEDGSRSARMLIGQQSQARQLQAQSGGQDVFP
jgi:hypothetical protein